MAREPFGTRLRSLRERAGMSQSELARKVGTDQGHISRWERNLAVPDTATVQRLAAALGVSAVELLIGRRPKSPNWGPSGAGGRPDARTGRGAAAASDESPPKKWLEAQEQVLLQEYQMATGKTARSLAEAEKWFAGLSLAERDRIGRRLNDPGIVGRYLQTPRIR
ncbi:MAG TPA: helix-turn-helix transcriptional regulator [Gemmataceae bacterium]|jgi:transcriptional regulator with XRE-family HTH domain|nr:helix-turn-helix transcriptional regulator [Gemmataceae bacterium]